MGYCSEASGFITGGTTDVVGVGTVYLDIISWEKTKYAAQRSQGWEMMDCDIASLPVRSFKLDSLEQKLESSHDWLRT
jgi:hypothetical protein